MTQIATITIGADSFDIYGLTSDVLADANSYFAASLNGAEWVAASDTTKKQALITAFRAIDRESWTGTKTDPVQDEQWPRDSATKCGEAVTDGVIPTDIVLGEFELALFLLKDAALLTKPNTASNVKSVKAGSAGVDFFYPLPGTTTRWPLPVNDHLACYLAGSTTATDIGLPYAGGTEESMFTADDADRSEGFA